MFTLLKDLRRLRRELALPRSDHGHDPGNDLSRGPGHTPSRSLAIRHVDAGSCNGCEHELTLTAGPHYDLQRFGLGVVASPRHADVLLVTGTVTTRMREPLLTAYAAMPEPRMVAALGNCAAGRDVIGMPGDLAGAVGDILPVDLVIPGCPPAPDLIARALLDLIDHDRRPGAPGITRRRSPT
ncbi:MAG TPA: hypothetical protein VNF47_26040 [Streptosporangiaceae bacterium]|nr:hypothetical protein [Streptosporangiaceae bacterium]